MISRIALIIIAGMALLLTVGVVVMSYQLATEPGDVVQKIASALLGYGVAAGIYAGLVVAAMKALGR